MFKLFRSKRKQIVTPFSNENQGIYDLDDQDLEQLIGGSPIRHLLTPPSSRGWQRTVPGQQLNHSRSASFQEAFTLQSQQPNTYWSQQEIQKHTENSNDDGA